MSISFPNESTDYRVARNRLLQREIELRRTIEAVAEARRQLPPGGVISQDYVFQQIGPDGTPTDVRLSQLFERGLDTLGLYNFMFPRAIDDERPCPGCTDFLDVLNGAALNIAQRINFVVVAKTKLSSLLAYAQERGWQHHLMSSAGNTYNRDYFGEDADGAQKPMFNVFRREGEVIRHFWGSELFYAPPDPGQAPRHLDTVDPFWNLLDLTPDGRGTD
jgi:predicted dithiol-disulfide oxidoreductase (DUF899 family)